MQSAKTLVNAVNADFMWAETVEDPFDAAVFFESFHHCSDHMRLLRALRQAVKPDGRAYFAAEPILPDFPIPWGLRMDGESLWAIRSNGWMELERIIAYRNRCGIPICGTALRSRCSIVAIPRAGAPICPAFSRSIGLLALMTFATGVT